MEGRPFLDRGIGRCEYERLLIHGPGCVPDPYSDNIARYLFVD